MCFFNNNGCFNPCRPACPPNVFTSATTQYIQGPQGPQGPQGAVGPQGPAGVNNALYAAGAAQAVETNGVVSLAAQTATPASTITVVGNAVSVPAGTYLVSFGVNVVNQQVGDEANFTLYANGVTTGEELYFGAGSTVGTVAEKTILYTATAATALTLVNTAAQTVDLTSAHVTVVKLA